MSYYKLYTSMFKNKTYVAEWTDLQKVLLMHVSSEMNRIEAANSHTGKANIMIFSHFRMSAALSAHRTKISKAFKDLKQYRLFDYTSGYNVKGKSAPSTIRNLTKEEYYVQIDRFTFEKLLYGYLKKKEIKHRHIIVYALCKYIEQFEGGSVSVNEFGHMLGMASGEIKYSRIKKPLEDLQKMKLINFEKKHGKIEGMTVNVFPYSHTQKETLRINIQEEAVQLRSQEMGIVNNEAAASVEDMAVPASLVDVIRNVQDIYAKRTGKKAVITAKQKQRFLGSQFTIPQIHTYIQQFFVQNDSLQLQRMNGEVLNNISTYLEGEYAEKLFGSRTNVAKMPELKKDKCS